MDKILLHTVELIHGTTLLMMQNWPLQSSHSKHHIRLIIDLFEESCINHAMHFMFHHFIFLKFLCIQSL